MLADVLRDSWVRVPPPASHSMLFWIGNFCSIKETMEDLEKTTKAGLDSAPELSKEQLTHGDDTSKELLYGGGGNDNKNKKIRDNNSSTGRL
ncbi:MAG: hypothetical protein K0S67_1728 [Nitrososphaeraceae archaeon]|nr:hypothetical protein [Nitrososphaeraceae archaeon]